MFYCSECKTSIKTPECFCKEDNSFYCKECGTTLEYKALGSQPELKAHLKKQLDELKTEETYNCPIFGQPLHYIEGVFMNELGEAEYSGYICKEYGCGYKEGDL